MIPRRFGLSCAICGCQKGLGLFCSGSVGRRRGTDPEALRPELRDLRLPEGFGFVLFGCRRPETKCGSGCDVVAEFFGSESGGNVRSVLRSGVALVFGARFSIGQTVARRLMVFSKTRAPKWRKYGFLT